MSAIKQSAPSEMPNADVLLRDQFIENVLDGSVRRELKQLVRRQPTVSLLDGRTEAIRWEREGTPGGARGRSHSVPSMTGLQCAAQTATTMVNSPMTSELQEVKQMLKLQQEQLNRLSETLVQLQTNPQRGHHPGPIFCRRCQRPGHSAHNCRARFVVLLLVEGGTVYVPITNVGTSDVLLYPRTEIGTLRAVSIVSLPSGVKEVRNLFMPPSLPRPPFLQCKSRLTPSACLHCPQRNSKKLGYSS